jgi:hypothetical protein
MGLFEMEISDSSEEELVADLQNSEDVISLASGLPETLEFYLIIMKKSSSGILL